MRSTTSSIASAIAVGDHQVEGGIGERPLTGRGRVGREGLAAAWPARMSAETFRRSGRAMRARIWLRAVAIASGIDVAADLAGDVGLARQAQHLRPEGRLQIVVLGDVGEGVDELNVEVDVLAARWPPAAPRVNERMASVCAACQRLNGSVSVRKRNKRSASRQVDVSRDRRREAAQQRRHRPRRHAVEDDCLLGSISWMTSPSTRPPVARSKARSSPFGPTRPKRTGMCSGSLVGWPGVGGHAGERQRVGLRRGVVDSPRAITSGVPAWLYHSRTGSGRPVGVGHGGKEVLDGHGLSRRGAGSRGPCRCGSPRRRAVVLSMRMTSAPFS